MARCNLQLFQNAVYYFRQVFNILFMVVMYFAYTETPPYNFMCACINQVDDERAFLIMFLIRIGYVAIKEWGTVSIVIRTVSPTPTPSPTEAPSGSPIRCVIVCISTAPHFSGVV